MQNILQFLGKTFLTGLIAIGTLFSPSVNTPVVSTPNVGATIPVSTAVFQTSLSSGITASATSMTLVNGANAAGNNLSGYTCFNIDEGTSLEEFVCGTASGTAVSSMIRGIDPVDGDLEVTALKKIHRRGASVKITDYPAIGIISRVVNGDETLPNKLSYASHPTFSSNTELIDKKYADDLAIAGAPDASTTTKGLVEESTQAETDARTTAGGTSARLFVNPSTLRATLYHDYAADAGANDTYTITVTPAPTAYTTGDVYVFKANTVNTGAATLNVNGLGAKSLKTNSNLDPVDGYIKAAADVAVLYDGTNMQILSVSGKPAVTQTGEELYAASSAGSDTYAITLTPAPVAYVTGMVVRFKADVANTGAATLNVNALGAKTIKKNVSSDLADNDIAANQIIAVIYDGTNFQIISPTADTAKSVISARIQSSSSTVQNVDTTVSTPFTAKTITLYYQINGIDASTSKSSQGIALYDTNGALILNRQFYVNQATAATMVTTNFIHNTTIPSAGAANSTYIIVTFSVTSVTSTGFTVRAAFTAQSGNPTGSVDIVAVATA